MGKSPAEPHTFSRYLNFWVGGAEIKLWCRGGEGVRAGSCCPLADFPPEPSGGPRGLSGEQTVGGRAGGPGPPRPRLGSAPRSLANHYSLVV